MGPRQRLREGFEGREAFEKRVASLDLTAINDRELKRLHDLANPSYDATSPVNESIAVELERRSGKVIVREPAPVAPTASKTTSVSAAQWGMIAALVAVAFIFWWQG